MMQPCGDSNNLGKCSARHFLGDAVGVTPAGAATVEHWATDAAGDVFAQCRRFLHNADPFLHNRRDLLGREVDFSRELVLGARDRPRYASGFGAPNVAWLLRS